jgi:CubicO group peptidase (beta-lactamase class C family)
MSKFENLDALMKKFLEKGPAGCALGLTKGGELIYENYEGYADVETKKPIAPDTIYRLYSMTKPLICTAGMLQFERGAFLLDDPIEDYIPEYKNMQIGKQLPDGSWVVEDAKKKPLVKHAFNMAIGLSGRREQNPTTEGVNRVNAELNEKYNGRYDHITQVRAMGSVPMFFEPGEHWQYGFGHELVNALVEVTSGMTIGEYMKKNIFEPCEMKSTAYRFFGDLESKMISCYTRNEDGTLTKRDTVRMDVNHQPDAIMEMGATGLFSTLRDYSNYSRMMACGGMYKGEKVIGRKTIDLMRRNILNETQYQEFTNTYNAGYGYGMGVRTMIDPAGHSNGSLGDFGWTGAAGTYLDIDPSEEFSIVYMHQMMPNMEEYHHIRIRNTAFGCL